MLIFLGNCSLLLSPSLSSPAFVFRSALDLKLQLFLPRIHPRKNCLFLAFEAYRIEENQLRRTSDDLLKKKKERDLEAQDIWCRSCLGGSGQLGPGFEWFSWETRTGWIPPDPAEVPGPCQSQGKVAGAWALHREGL